MTCTPNTPKTIRGKRARIEGRLLAGTLDAPEDVGAVVVHSRVATSSRDLGRAVREAVRTMQYRAIEARCIGVRVELVRLVDGEIDAEEEAEREERRKGTDVLPRVLPRKAGKAGRR